MRGKKKKPIRYNIFVMPEGTASVKKWHIPRWFLKVLGGFVAMWTIVTAVLVGTSIYYRSGWLATKDIRDQNEELQAEKIKIVEKLSSIEATAGRAEKLANTLESVVGISKKGLSKSIGPISEDDNLPIPKALTSFRKYELNTNSETSPQIAFDDLEVEMGGLENALTSVEMRLHDVYEFHNDKLAYWASVPSIWPVRGWVTSGFGVRRSPKGIGTRFHEGLDIAAPPGTTVFAPGDGVVTFAGYKHGLGKTLIIDHGFGVSTVFGHNSQLFVREGDRVKRGTSIAAVGRTGRSTGPHLHYQVMVDGMPVDPMRYIIENF